jgi:uncharacterized protein (TIGR03382 family)
MASTSLLSLAALTILGTAAGCVDDSAFVGQESQPIINGARCAPSEMPTTVALLVDATVDFGGQSYPIRTLVCTGTLIAPDTVLTAAHCVDDAALTGGFGTLTSKTHYISRTEDLRSLLEMGQTLPNLPSDARPVRSVVKHETFTLDVQELPDGLSQFYDIGLVFLEEPMENIEPAIVMTPEEAKGLGVGIDVQIAGWGQQTIDSEGPIGTKHCATAKIFEINDFEMQIGNEPSTARKCHGDSGGPTMLTISTETRRKDRVIGATSRAYDSSDCGKGGVDTLASAYYQWINDRMKERCDAGQRAWCEVPGIVAPSYYDDLDSPPLPSSESGGCNSGGSSGGLAALALFGLLAWIRRANFIA